MGYTCLKAVIAAMKAYADSEKKSEAVKFLKWCNEPIFRMAGSLTFDKRATAQYPDYKYYIIIDENGRRTLPEGVFLTETELYEHWKKTTK